ncbi:MAG: NADH-quinone oxidoreductase subunit A [Planctomycetia bacterium]|nr:NADH-quinone oxidoreductase subunit A [Planctomycetia bacterium]
MPDLVGYLVLFLAVGVGFILVHLLVGKLIRPAKAHDDKLTIYECGEPTIGSAWVQFDVRYYVIALLFVIFDVEVAFFFPWAVVFGKATELAQPNLPEARRQLLNRELAPVATSAAQPQPTPAPATVEPQANAAAARMFSWIAFVDILVFFGVLLVGFAYLWKRGDLNWVRTFDLEKSAATPPPAPSEPLAAAG